MPNFKYIFVFVFAFLIKEVQCQVYPVQGTAGLIPPYALRLSDYTTSSSERFALNVLLADVTKADLHVRFRISITGQNVKLETKPEYIGSIITMQGGVPLRLTNVELAEYFDPNHLNFSGISKSDFLKTGILPEGFYQFCFEVIEYNRGVQISNSICAPAWLILNDPPLINLPLNGSKLKPLFPQNVMLQWTPRHTGSPNAAFTTEYEVKVVEVWPANRNPNDAILSQPAIYETTTNSTSLIYGPDATQLEPGRTYAFRVQAKAMTGAETLDLFKNNGYSETVSFMYGDACDPPMNIVAQAETPSRVSLQWDASPSQTGYTVHYRTKGKSDANWYSTTSLITSAEISDLQPNTTYEYEVMSTCGSFESTFGNIATITTPDLSQKGYSCGVTSPDFNLDPSQLLPILKVNDVVNTGDFDVTITKVSGANGVFSGEGAVVVPFLNQVRARVNFQNITVNNDKRMVNGFMNVTGAGIEVVPSGVMSMMDQLSQGLDVAQKALDSLAKLFPPKPDPATFVATEEIKIPEGISRVFRDPISGDVIVVDNKGGTQKIPAGQDVVVTDGKGNGALVNAQGGVTNTTAAQAVACTKRELNLNLTFARTSNTKNGFDEQKYEDLKKYYEKLGDKYVAWKSVPTSAGDRVAAKYNGTDVKLNTIKFDQGGTPLEATVTGTSVEFTAYSVAEGVTSSVVARYTPADTAKKEQILGKLNVVGYEDKSFTVHIVPVNGVVSPADKAAIESKLKEVYSQAVVSWTVAMEKNFQVGGLSSPFDNGSSGLLSNYTKDMRTVINSYDDSNPLKEDDYYLFLVPPGSNAGQDGFMPRSKQCGFIFVLTNSSAVSVSRAIAHELGHGPFTLKHTFQQYPSISEKSTDNLMDYNNGTQLWKYQWDQIHDPVTVLGLFESDGAGSSYTFVLSNKFLNTDKKTVSFATYNGDYITIEKDKLVNITLNYGTTDFKTTARQVPGVLQKFTLTGNKVYEIDLSDGIYKNGTEVFNEDQSIKDSDIDGVILGLPCNTTFNVYKFSKSNLGRYSAQPKANYVQDVIDFKLRPFAANSPISDGSSVLQQTITTVEQDGCYWCMDNATASMTKPYCQKPELIYVTKIAQFRVAFPNDFETFTSKGDDWANPYLKDDINSPISTSAPVAVYPKIPNGAWGNYLSTNPTLVADFKNGKTENFFKVMYSQFYSYLQNRSSNSSAFWTALTADTLASSVLRETKKLGFDELKKLNFDKRKIAVKTLMQTDLFEPYENAVISLAGGLNDSERQLMAEFFASDVLFENVIHKFHDAAGEPNYTSIITILSAYLNVEGKTISPDKLQRAYDGEQPTVDIGVINNQSSYSIKGNQIVFKYSIVSSDAAGAAVIEYKDFYSANYDELIPLKFASNFNLGGRQFNKNDLISMPAIYACLLLDKGTSKSLQKQGWFAVDALLFVVGAGEAKIILQSGNWLRKLMVGADLVGSGTNLILDAGLEGKLPQSLVDKWRWANLAMSLPQGISSLKKVADDIIKNSRDAEKALSAADQSLLEKKIITLEEQVGKTDDVASVVSDPVIKGGNDFKKLFTKSPDLKTLFDGLPTSVKANFSSLTEGTLEDILTKLKNNSSLLEAINNTPDIAKLWTKHKNQFSASELEDALNNYAEAATDFSDDLRKQIDDLADESGAKQQMLERFEKGNDFGDLIKGQLADVNSDAYKALKKEFDLANKNLDEYTIYSQVQLCLKGDCISKGNYWIPDFVAVIEKYDDVLNKSYLEAIIIDSKLSKATDWTKNQKAAKLLDGWSVKADPRLPIKGTPIDLFKQNAFAKKDGSFIKIFSEDGLIKSNR